MAIHGAAQRIGLWLQQETVLTVDVMPQRPDSRMLLDSRMHSLLSSRWSAWSVGASDLAGLIYESAVR